MDTLKRCSACGFVYEGDACTQCAARFIEKTTTPLPPSTGTPLRPGEVFHGLEVQRLLGCGGMGMVFRARQPALDRLVALKILSHAFAQIPDFQNRFGREAKALAALSHPNIVAIHDFGSEGGRFFLVMEYVDGVNLRRLLQEKKLGLHEALRIVPQLCDALEYAHGEGVVHRDIKPENILLDRKGRVKIADFGLAKLVGSEAPALTETNVVMGTPHYMAPEQIENPKAVDHRADLYSLGVVFYEMLTGELPLGKFEAPSKKVELDVRFDEVVLKSLEKRPELRYQKASEVKEAVTGLGAAPAPRRASRAILVAAGLLVAALALFAIAYRNPRSGDPHPQVNRAADPEIEFERIYFRPDEKPAERDWLGPNQGFPRNPFPAKDAEEVALLLKYMNTVGLINASRADIRHGYVAGWWGVGVLAVDCVAVERLEREFRSNRRYALRWSFRRGTFLVVAYAPDRGTRIPFADLVMRIQAKLGLPPAVPEVPIENVAINRIDVPHPWVLADRFEDCSLPFVGSTDVEKERLLPHLQTLVEVKPQEVRAVCCAAFQRPGAAPTAVMAGLEFEDRARAEAVARQAAAVRGWRGARKTEVLQTAGTVVVLALFSDELREFGRVARMFRDWMGYPEWSVESLAPAVGDLPEGVTLDRVVDVRAEILTRWGLSDVSAVEVPRAYEATLAPAGTIVILEVSDYQKRSEISSRLKERGPCYEQDRWLCLVLGPESVQDMMRQKFDR